MITRISFASQPTDVAWTVSECDQPCPWVTDDGSRIKPPTHLNWGQFTDKFCHIYNRVLIVTINIDCIPVYKCI